MRVTMVGAGSMGRAIAVRLLVAGHDLTVWNRTPGRVGDLVERGATEARDVASAVAGADAVLVSVRDDDAVAELAPQLADCPAPVANCTTSAPARTAEHARAIPNYVAAPILGAPMAVADGTATYVVAGPEQVVGRLEPMWPALGDNVRRVGTDPSAASVIKVAVNHLLLTGVVALAEAVAVAQAAGLPDDLLRDVLGSSAMVATGLRNRLADIVDGSHDGWFAMPMGAKDLGLFLDLAASSGVQPVLAELARRRYVEAADAGLADADIAGVVELLRR